MNLNATDCGQRRTGSGVVVVTGASAGVGRAIVETFAADGWDVALLARESRRLTAAAEAVRRGGRRALAIPVDVADARAVESAADQVEATLGSIDVWVNDAMATVFAPVAALSPSDIRRATEVTYLGTVWGTLAALGRMRERDRGTIIQIGSALAYRSIPLQAPYCAAKAAIRGFTDSLRCELAHDRSRVRVTFVVLSAFNTPQFEWGRTALSRRPRPMGKIFQPEIAARAVLRAARRPRREIWVGWPAVQSTIGQRLIPGLLDRILGRSAWDGQQSDEPLPRRRPDNLYHAVDRPHGAHGRFDHVATSFSVQAWLSEHRLASALTGAAMLWVAGRLLRSRSGGPR
ncbi:MAG: SDR family oxidoreductase [Burkholderiaceae bacterium]